MLCDYPPSFCWYLGSSSSGGSGSFSNVGVGGFEGVIPVLVKAEVFCRNFASASMPSLVPRISGRDMLFATFSRMLRCCSYLGHSSRMWVLVSRVSSSQGQVTGSGDRGRKDLRNSPVYAWPGRPLHCYHDSLRISHATKSNGKRGETGRRTSSS